MHDYLRWCMWWQSDAGLSGPWMVRAGQVAIAGCQAGMVGRAGAATANDGTCAGQVRIAGAAAGQVGGFME
jgi:hypothetical protein